MTAAIPSNTFAIPAGLLADNPNPDAKKLFCLFTQDWITMQTFIVQALQLPINVGDFKQKYGKFKDEDEIKNCVNAMKDIQNLSVQFGNPQTLITQLATNPAILQTDTAPKELYIHIVWFATKLYQTAITFNQTFAQLMQMLTILPADQLLPTVTAILTGPGGLQTSAETMKTLANTLVQDMAKFLDLLTPATTTMTVYTNSSSTFVEDVKKDIGQDAQDIQTFQDQADTAYKLWRDLTISAVTTSVGTLVLSGGFAWPVSAALATGLGVEAQKARNAYDDACAARNRAEEDKQKKMTLQNDLGAFNTQMVPATKAANAFLADLQKVEGVWTNIGTQLNFIATNFTPDSFKDLPAWRDAMRLDSATQDWKIIADTAAEYTANSLVTYTVLKFGDTLPADTTPKA
jgi:hypothetical protein